MTSLDLKRVEGRFKKRRKWWSGFRSVIEYYQEAQETSGSPGALNYEQAAVGAGSGFVVGKINMTLSDLIADVEIAARRALSDTQHSFFLRVYKGRGEKGRNELTRVLDVQVQEALGRDFVDNGIYPVSKYMRSVRT